MKLKLFLFACAIVLFTACGNEPKKTETKTDEIPEIRDDKEEMVIKETPISLEDQINTIKMLAFVYDFSQIPIVLIKKLVPFYGIIVVDIHLTCIKK